MKISLKLAVAFCAAGLLASSFGCASSSMHSMKAGQTKSLYDRLGGAYPIALVVDDLCARLLADPVILANQAAVSKLPPEHIPGLKFHITALLCQVTGGPQAYFGKSMKDAHLDMHISAQEWDAMVKDTQATLDHFHVPAQEQRELLEIIGSTRADIVEPGR